MKLFHLINKPITYLLLVALLSVPSASLAKEKIFLTGAEGGVGDSATYYTYAGLIAPLFDNNLGDGLVQRYWIDYLGYSYNSFEEIDAQAVGLEGALGYQKSNQDGWYAGYLGLRYNNTSLSPDDPGNRTAGDHVWFKTQLEGETKLGTALKLSGIASYTFDIDSFWMRTRLTHRLNNGLFTGPELIHMGDNSYRAWQFDWVLTGFKFGERWEMGIKAGARITEGADVVGLIGLEFLNIF